MRQLLLFLPVLVAACETVLAERLTGMGGSRGAALLSAAGVLVEQD